MKKSEPAADFDEAVEQMLLFAQRQDRDCEQQSAYAATQIDKHTGTNREYYEGEVTRCAGRKAYFDPHVEALQCVKDHMIGDDSEMMQQARLLGMSAEREAKLLAQIAMLKKAMVTAVLPLEAIRMSGSDAAFCQDVRDAIHDGVIAVREALADG